jgi:transcriptional regulator with XRE-family HTH domain
MNLNLKFAILRSGKKQKDVAAAAGMSDGELSKIIHSGEVSREQRRDIARALRLPQRALFPIDHADALIDRRCGEDRRRSIA